MKIEQKHHESIVCLLDRLTKAVTANNNGKSAFDHQELTSLSLEAQGLLCRIREDHNDTMPPPWGEEHVRTVID